SAICFIHGARRNPTGKTKKIGRRRMSSQRWKGDGIFPPATVHVKPFQTRKLHCVVGFRFAPWMGRVEAQNQKSSTPETTMRVAYLTTDEVNEEQARQMAQECGLTLCPLAPKDDPPDGAYDAVLYDWDSWPAEGRREALAAMLAGPLPHAVALHGYHLEDDQ